MVEKMGGKRLVVDRGYLVLEFAGAELGKAAG